MEQLRFIVGADRERDWVVPVAECRDVSAHWRGLSANGGCSDGAPMGNSLYGVWRVCVNHNVVVCCSPVFVAVECTDGNGVLSVGAGRK